MELVLPTKLDYNELLGSIKDRINKAQYAALSSVNRELIQLYWDIGKIIVERQQHSGWGKGVIETLSTDLQLNYPGIKGFSARNLWRMRDFYNSYNSNIKLTTLLAEISWSHHVVILARCEGLEEREFYIRMAAKFSWSVRALNNHIDNQAYEKTLLNQTNFDKTLPKGIKARAKLAVKDEYTFDFLELGDDFTERQFENALTMNTEKFLQEMGGAFAFMGRQYRLEIDSQEFFIDLLLYHRYLKCLVAIELKRGDFIPEYVGKMQFYLAALDNLVRTKWENPSIGIILCKSKSKTIVEFALKETKKPIGVAAYTITKKLPKELRDKLPTNEQIAQLLDQIS